MGSFMASPQLGRLATVLRACRFLTAQGQEILRPLNGLGDFSQEFFQVLL